MFFVRKPPKLIADSESASKPDPGVSRGCLGVSWAVSGGYPGNIPGGTRGETLPGLPRPYPDPTETLTDPTQALPDHTPDPTQTHLVGSGWFLLRIGVESTDAQNLR